MLAEGRGCVHSLTLAPSVSDSRGTRARRVALEKAVVDAAIARVTPTRGLLSVLTSNGKRRSSAAFGMLARALGHGMQVAVFQFIKGTPR